jgi:hypothetical protein
VKSAANGSCHSQRLDRTQVATSGRQSRLDQAFAEKLPVFLAFKEDVAIKVVGGREVGPPLQDRRDLGLRLSRLPELGVTGCEPR